MRTRCSCCHSDGRPILQWEYTGLGNSVFNYTACFYHCSQCGLVWIANIEDAMLARFYAEECFYFENAHFDIHAPANQKKFGFYRSLLPDSETVVDVGCGRGGFLYWLAEVEPKRSSVGVDMDIKSLPESTVGAFPRFLQGTAKSLPFENKSQLILTYFHVLEHIVDIDAVLSEAYRVLCDFGTIIIEVPDASRYEDLPIGEGFWFSIREHVNHFSPAALAHVLQRNGFSAVAVHQQELPTPEFTYASLILTAQKSSAVESLKMYPNDTAIDRFLEKTYQAIRARGKYISQRMKEYDKVLFWGISNQLLSTLPHLNIPNEKITLCDISREKQKLTCAGLSIQHPPTEKRTETLLIASSFLHCQDIKTRTLLLGWDNNSILELFEKR